MLAASRGGPPSLPNRTNSLDIPKASKSPAPVPSRASKPRSRSPSVASIYVVPVQKPGAVASLGIMPEEPRSEGGGAGKLMKVLADYSGEGEMYLTVRAGNKVMTVEDDDYNWPGWSYVEKDGRRGLVPSDYLELVPSSLSSAVPPPVSHPSNHTSAFQPTAKNMHKSARVLYDYSGDANEGVLTIRQGDIVKVVDPDVGPGWVEAMLNDTTGLIPESYIEYI
ncbi:Protein BZZ1 [Spiromyces aspiralis]|uniref:Protein BZZ1 n=1 Tax=Spiromyces aspiralis TaxID=68401 RepID=A0ACC1HTR4_9FUNG|nr:Protein BZZ1 [Spiromyces aspiralis]